MALRQAAAKRLFIKLRKPSPLATLEHSPNSSPSFRNAPIPQNAAKTNFHREFLTSPDPPRGGFFRRFLHRRELNQSARLPEFMIAPVGERLMEKLKSMNVAGDRLRLESLIPPGTSIPPPSNSLPRISVHDAKRIMRSMQLEKLRSALRQIPANSISYSEYLQTCVNVCPNTEQATELAKNLDESGNVIVLGDTVFIRPDQVARSMAKLISDSIAAPNDPRRKELEQMEIQKLAIDEKAKWLVRTELYCGLGYLVLQTAGFMRLTFWELSWDVMEPICFFVTSMHFALAYAFFLRTCIEPSFEGYFHRRFRTKQRKLMKAHNFDVEKYNELCRVFYPNYGDLPASDLAGGPVFAAARR
ncbi:hypothetical protein NMG60_11024317 [Bertholletia excelsa]